MQSWLCNTTTFSLTFVKVIHSWLSSEGYRNRLTFFPLPLLIKSTMRYQGLFILLSCHGLEDFPVYQKGDEANSLLANWTAMWHPLLMHAAGTAPGWSRIDNPPEDVAGKLLLVPLSQQNELQTGFAQRVQDDGGRLIKGLLDRWEIVRQATAELELNEGEPLPEVSEDLVRDFFALGYCYLQIQVLTRHMRYSSNLDQVFFDKQLLAAAAAACTGQEDQARELLGKCFDVLAEERNHFYPVDAFLMDVTLVAHTTLGASLKQQLAQQHPQSWMISARDVESLQHSAPETFDQLKQAIAAKRVEILGGNYQEMPFPLMSQETMVRQFKKSIERYQQLLDARPYVFARRRFGLSPALPQILEQFGFRGAIHVTLDEGKFPEGIQAKTRWEGAGDASIEALAKIPLEIDKPESFLNLGIKLGEAMDMDHLSIIWFAHWPNQHCEWFEDLVRTRKYCNALGKFVTLSEFFVETESPLHSDRFGADQYRSPYLRQIVMGHEANPISRSADFWQREARLEAINALSFLTQMLGKPPGSSLPQLNEWGEQIDELFDRVQPAPSDSESAADPDAAAHQPLDNTDPIDEKLQLAIQQNAAALATAIPAQDASQPGLLVVNPHSFIRRMLVDVSQLANLPDVAKPIYAADQSAQSKHAVVDVPPLGFAWIGSGKGTSQNSRDPLLAEGNLLRNEFMEVVLDEEAGSIRAIHDYQSRTNRLSQKVALRYPRKSDEESESTQQDWIYSRMVADSIDVMTASRTLGEIEVKGKLMRGKNLAGGFVAHYRLFRGSRVLECCLDIDPKDTLSNDAWESYYGLRFAWNDESAELSRSSQQMRQKVVNKKFESSHYFEIESGDARTTILNGGLTFFRQLGFRSIDLPLITRGETATRFRFGIGIDLTHPMQHAIAFLNPPIVVPVEFKPKPDHCWLFHLDAKNIIATWWEPVSDGQQVTGFRVRLLETMGRGAKVNVSAMRPITAGNRQNLLGETKQSCKIDNDRLQFELAAHELVELEARF
jgi:alpha-mannosidase